MAKSQQIIDNTVVMPTWASWLRVVGIGAGIGLLYWVLTILIGTYVVEPLACREAASCASADSIAGKVATVLATVVAIFAMVRLSIVRPIIVAVAAAVLLWDLSVYTAGLFWLEAVAWSVLAYALVYGLFGWVVRSMSLVLAIIIAVLVVVAIRVALIL